MKLFIQINHIYLVSSLFLSLSLSLLALITAFARVCLPAQPTPLRMLFNVVTHFWIPDILNCLKRLETRYFEPIKKFNLKQHFKALMLKKI